MGTPQQAASQVTPAGLGEPFGEILVRKGRLARHELDQALVEARARGQRLGEYLASIGAVYEEDIAQALAEQYHLRYFTIDPRGLDRKNSMIMPEAVARRLVALPLRHTDEAVVVAVADPTDVFGTDELQMVVGRPVELVVCERSSIEAGIRALYSPGSHWMDDEPIVGGSMPAAVEIAPEADAGPTEEAAEGLLHKAIGLGASQLELVPRKEDLLVRVRVNGVLQDLEIVPLAARGATVARVKALAQLEGDERRLPQTGRVSMSLEGATIDLRTASLPSTHGEHLTLRITYLGREPVGLEQLGLDDATWSVFGPALHRPSGVILLAGPTGSGKTTTLYAALAELNDGSRTVAGIEDPVEADIDGVVQVQVDRRVGLSLAQGLNGVVQSGADVVFAGTLADAETADVALRAALTGRLVLATIEADGAAAALVSLRNLGIDAVTIGSTVRCVVAQQLVLATGDAGYHGRVGVFEAFALSEGVQQVLDGSTVEIQAAAVAAGMRPLCERARELAARGVTTVEEAARLGDDDEL